MKIPALATALGVVVSLALTAAPAHPFGESTATPTTTATSTTAYVGQTTTSLQLKATSKGHRAKARVKLVADTGDKTYPIVEQQVVLQKKVGKKWKTFITLFTSGTGTAKARFKVRKQTLIRARYAGSGQVVVGGSGEALPAATSTVVRVG